MKITGIISEYNPFHNGHLYQINELRKRGTTHIVAVMSGNFVQRGDFALYNKFARAKAAVLCGADLVIELPTRFALSSAENFAHGGVFLLDSLNVINELCFGSESGDTDGIKKAAELLSINDIINDIKKLTKAGTPYPKAAETILKNFGCEKFLTTPNDTLGVMYIKALQKLNSKITPNIILREGANHDSLLTPNSPLLTPHSSLLTKISSASYIRNLTNKKEAKKYMPPPSYNEMLKTPNASIENADRTILARLRNKDFKNIADVSEGIENRFKHAVNEACSTEEIITLMKCGRYTNSRIRRLIMSAALDITQEYAKTDPYYIRVLALNNKGSEILAESRKKAKLPKITSFAAATALGQEYREEFLKESSYSDFYALALPDIGKPSMDLVAKIDKL